MTAADLVKWISPLAAVAVFTVMLSLRLLLERRQIATRNAAPPDVTASVFGRALGLAGMIFVFVAGRKSSYHRVRI